MGILVNMPTEALVEGFEVPPCGLTTTVYSSSDWPRVAGLWSELASSSPYCSFFLTAEWIESWIETFGDTLKPKIITFEAQGHVVGMCLLVFRKVYEGPFPVWRVYLNTGGEDEADETFAELNSLLCSTGWEEEVATALRMYLNTERWDEFVASGLCEGPVLRALESIAFPELAQSRNATSCFYVDLGKIRESKVTYEDSLSHNSRRQIKRSLRMYAANGEVRVEAPDSVAEALNFLQELAELHQRRWTSLGRPGCFASPRFLSFHRNLIQRAFSSGAIQMLRVAAGEETIGVLYNVVYRGKVFCYQFGLQYDADNRLKPGLVANTCAINYSLQQGLEEYDLSAGSKRYKESLSTDSRELVWMVFRKPSVKLRIMDHLRDAKQLLGKAFRSPLNEKSQRPEDVSS